MKTKYFIVFIIILVVIGASIFGISWGQVYSGKSVAVLDDENREKVRVGYLSIANSLPLYVAKERGYLENMNIETVKYKTSNGLAEAILSDKIDFAISPSTSVFYKLESKTPGQFKIISVNLQTEQKFPDYIVANSNSNVHQVTDLENKKLGVFPGSTMRMMAEEILREFNISDSVSIEEIPPTSQLNALNSEKVDAIYTLEPFATLAIQKLQARVVSEAPTEKHVLNPLPAGVSIVSSDFLNNNPETSREFVDAYDKAIDFIRNNDNEARNYIPKYTPMNIELSQDINIVHFQKSHEINNEPLQIYAELLYKKDVLRREVSVESLVLN